MKTTPRFRVSGTARPLPLSSHLKWIYKPEPRLERLDRLADQREQESGPFVKVLSLRSNERARVIERQRHLGEEDLGLRIDYANAPAQGSAAPPDRG